MGQLRTALRAYAVEGNGPARILTLLHRMLRHQQPRAVRDLCDRPVHAR